MFVLCLILEALREDILGHLGLAYLFQGNYIRGCHIGCRSSILEVLRTHPAKAAFYFDPFQQMMTGWLEAVTRASPFLGKLGSFAKRFIGVWTSRWVLRRSWWVRFVVNQPFLMRFSVLVPGEWVCLSSKPFCNPKAEWRFIRPLLSGCHETLFPSAIPFWIPNLCEWVILSGLSLLMAYWTLRGDLSGADLSE